MPAAGPFTAATMGLGMSSGNVFGRHARDEGRAPGDPGEGLCVQPGAEPATGAGDDDGAHGGVGRRVGQQVEVPLLHRQGPCVEALGPVEGEQEHPAVALVARRRRGRTSIRSRS